jgi:hypothetical protein
MSRAAPSSRWLPFMAQADLDDDAPAAWGLLFTEVFRVAQAVHDAHLARSGPEQAGRLADEARKALEEEWIRRGRGGAPRAGTGRGEGGEGPGPPFGKGGPRPEQFAGTTPRLAPPKRSSDVGR